MKANKPKPNSNPKKFIFLSKQRIKEINEELILIYSIKSHIILICQF